MFWNRTPYHAFRFRLEDNPDWNRTRSGRKRGGRKFLAEIYSYSFDFLVGLKFLLRLRYIFGLLGFIGI
jgi:hypothetical protein